MGTIAGHQLSSFTSPVNGTTPIDANTVRGNDNTIRSSYNAHDADTTIHLQSGLVASRPAASTAQQTWLATDTGAVYLWLDTGSVWVEVNYLRNTGGTVSGAVTFAAGATISSGQTLTLTGATVAGTPTWSSAQAITLSTAAQPNITSVGTLTSVTVSGASTLQAVTASSNVSLLTNNTFLIGFTGGGTPRRLIGVPAGGQVSIDPDGVSTVFGADITATTALFSALPTSDPGTPGALWRSGADVKVSI